MECDLSLVLPHAYWVVPKLLLAGAYPGDRNIDEARRKIDALLDCGIRLAVDLTEKWEYSLHPYSHFLHDAASERKVETEHRRISFPDLAAPPPSRMREILDVIDSSIEREVPLYVHCFGGIGRTGTVVGCWLVRHGMKGKEAIDRIAEWRKDTPEGFRSSPETPHRLRTRICRSNRTRYPCLF